MADKKLPLEGIRVADFSWVSAGPRGTRVLGNFGAEVIKIESAGRLDLNRGRPPFMPGNRGVNATALFNNVNCDKLGITLNLRHPKGRELAKKLCAISDIVIDNFNPGVMKKMGLGYDDLIKIKPDIIVISMPVMGETGPRASYGGYGMGIEAISGLKYISGYPGKMPLGTGIAYPDSGPNPRHAMVAVMAALHYRNKTGKGQFIELAQYESTVCFTGTALLEYTANNKIQGPWGGRLPNAAPHGTYRCKGDDEWCVIAVFTDDEWKAFKKAIDNPSWANDKKFATLADRKKNEDELDRLVNAWTLPKGAREVMELLQNAGVGAGVIQTGRDLLDNDQQLIQRHYVKVEHPEGGPQTVDGVRIKLSATPGRIQRPAPLLGEHNEYVFKKLLGIPDEEFDMLLVDQVLY
ncbi:MAG: CoA transferase [Chloroflexi bacterium]|nr:CoA transferase [Chloroflexota bacterium]